MRASLAAPLSIPGAKHLTRRGETVLDFSLDRPGAPQYAALNIEARAFPHFGTFDPNAQQISNPIPPPLQQSSILGTGFNDWGAVVRATGADTISGFGPGYANRPLKVRFHDVPRPRLVGLAAETDVEAFCFEVMLRRFDTTQILNAFTGVFLYHGGQGAVSPTIPNFSDPRVGLVGDGAMGFRFGSIGCPNGAPATTSESAIDAGSVQPASLINPGEAEFTVTLKAVPAHIGATARIDCFLDGALVVSFTSVNNFPLGRANNATFNYSSIYPYVSQFQPAVVPQRCGLIIRRMAYWWDSNLDPAL